MMHNVTIPSVRRSFHYEAYFSWYKVKTDVHYYCTKRSHPRFWAVFSRHTVWFWLQALLTFNKSILKAIWLFFSLNEHGNDNAMSIWIYAECTFWWLLSRLIQLFNLALRFLKMAHFIDRITSSELMNYHEYLLVYNIMFYKKFI